MKESRIMKVFDKYVQKFNMNKGNVKMMYFHSIKVSELCKDIASSVGIFTEEEILVCKLIGLFHGIASFNNNYSTYVYDADTDYNKKSVEILFDSEDSLMRKITDDTRYDDIIKIAIYCENKNGLPSSGKIGDKALHFCKVLKDAHSLDNFRMILNYPIIDTKIDAFPSDLVYSTFKMYQVINNKISDNDADIVLENVSKIFGFNYKYSYYILLEEDYITKLVNILNFGNKNIYKFFKQINIVLNNYIKNKIGD